MIQRIQTVYLLLATVLMSLTLFLPLATSWCGVDEVVVKAFSISGTLGFDAPLPIYLGAVLSVATLLPFVIIFLFKNRLTQIRLCVSAIVLLLGSAAMIALYCYRLYTLLSAMMAELHITLGFASIMPVVAIIFVALAIRGIAKDEALVRSLDRIR